jgi:hypothetical protein
MEEEYKMHRNFSIWFILIILSCVNSCVVNYNNLMKKQIDIMPSELFIKLEEQKVIIIGDPLFVDVDTIDGQKISNVIISNKLVSDPEKRYFIAHLIRNILIYGAVIYNYDEKGNDFIMYPVVEVSDEFIKDNKYLICDVIYYLLHKDHFNLHGNPGSSGQKIFFSPLLANISDEINELKDKLLREDGLIQIDMEIINRN